MLLSLNQFSTLLTSPSVSKIGFIQSPLWNNAKMNALRNIRELDEYYERYDVSGRVSSHGLDES